MVSGQNTVVLPLFVLLASGCPESSTPPSPCGDARIDFRISFPGEPAIEGCGALQDGKIEETYDPSSCEPSGIDGRTLRTDSVPDGVPSVSVGANMGVHFGTAGVVEVFVATSGRGPPFCATDGSCRFSNGDCRAEVVSPGHVGDTIEVRLAEPCMLREIDDPTVTRLPTVEWLVMRGPVVARSGADGGLPDCGF